MVGPVPRACRLPLPLCQGGSAFRARANARAERCLVWSAGSNILDRESQEMSGERKNTEQAWGGNPETAFPNQRGGAEITGAPDSSTLLRAFRDVLVARGIEKRTGEARKQVSKSGKSVWNVFQILGFRTVLEPFRTGLDPVLEF